MNNKKMSSTKNSPKVSYGSRGFFAIPMMSLLNACIYPRHPNSFKYLGFGGVKGTQTKAFRLSRCLGVQTHTDKVFGRLGLDKT